MEPCGGGRLVGPFLVGRNLASHVLTWRFRPLALQKGRGGSAGTHPAPGPVGVRSTCRRSPAHEEVGVKRNNNNKRLRSGAGEL